MRLHTVLASNPQSADSMPHGRSICRDSKRLSQLAARNPGGSNMRDITRWRSPLDFANFAGLPTNIVLTKANQINNLEMGRAIQSFLTINLTAV